MFYKRIAEALADGERSVLITIIARAGTGYPPVGHTRFWSPGEAAGNLGEEWLNREADRMARRVLDSGELEKRRLASPAQPDGHFTLVAEPVLLSEELVVLGGGNIARPLVQIAALLGYKITVVDDRPAFASPGLFPAAARVVCDDFQKALAEIRLGPWCSAVIITRGHRHDLACLERLIGLDLAYLGMIGSRRRIKLVRAHLQEQGVPEARLDRVHMPIGLSIGAQTTAEIAASIAAELVKVRRGGTARSLAEETGGGRVFPGRQGASCSIAGEEAGLWQALAECEEHKTPVVLATVVSTKGSTPRKAGAKMLIFRDGRSLGTIGGGCVEGEVRREALDVFDSGVPRLFNYLLDSEAAADEGMACGGAMEVFLMPVTGEAAAHA